MKKTVLLLISILILLIIGYIFRYVKFAEGVNKDVKIKFNIAKNYIHGVSFEGIIVGKRETNKKYFIDIALDKIDSLPTVSQQCTLMPYYELKGDTILCLSIPHEIYTNVELFKPIIKLANSNYLKIQNDTFLFLSSVNDQWFSCQ